MLTLQNETLEDSIETDLSIETLEDVKKRLAHLFI